MAGDARGASIPSRELRCALEPPAVQGERVRPSRRFGDHSSGSAGSLAVSVASPLTPSSALWGWPGNAASPNHLGQLSHLRGASQTSTLVKTRIVTLPAPRRVSEAAALGWAPEAIFLTSFKVMLFQPGHGTEDHCSSKLQCGLTVSSDTSDSEGHGLWQPPR